MTDIEQKALALVNEVNSYTHWNDIRDVGQGPMVKALCRAIEQHEAFRQEVSDTVKAAATVGSPWVKECLARFIIAKPDPLVEALDEALWEVSNVKLTDRELRAVSLRLNAKCGGKIEGEG